MPQNNKSIKMDRIVETNRPHQHQLHPHHLRLILLFVRCFLIFIRFIEIPFKCRRRSSSSCYILLMNTIMIIIIGNLCCGVCVWSVFVVQTDRQRRRNGGRVWWIWGSGDPRRQLLFPLFGALLSRSNLFDCLFIFLPSLRFGSDLKSKFMFAIKTRSPTRSHN